LVVVGVVDVVFHFVVVIPVLIPETYLLSWVEIRLSIDEMLLMLMLLLLLLLVFWFLLLWLLLFLLLLLILET